MMFVSAVGENQTTTGDFSLFNTAPRTDALRVQKVLS
jgi:hypothetical protein